MSNSEPLPEGTVIMAAEQYNGRGQQNNTWYSEPGKNLTFSLILNPVFLDVGKQFYLNMCISAGIVKALNKVTGQNFTIKWPNDIYFENRKIGGILIENIIGGSRFKYSIVGIGINVNQRHFDENLSSRAQSLVNILHAEQDINELLREICMAIEPLYLKLKAGDFQLLRESYISDLYKFEVQSNYRQNGEIFSAQIIGVSELGRLILQKENETIQCDFKEIVFLEA